MKDPRNARDEAEEECYEYFNKNIRALPKSGWFSRQRCDAFRYSYVSGVFTQEYGENTADIFGRMNEYLPSKE